MNTLRSLGWICAIILMLVFACLYGYRPLLVYLLITIGVIVFTSLFDKDGILDVYVPGNTKLPRKWTNCGFYICLVFSCIWYPLEIKFNGYGTLGFKYCLPIGAIFSLLLFFDQEKPFLSQKSEKKIINFGHKIYPWVLFTFVFGKILLSYFPRDEIKSLFNTISFNCHLVVKMIVVYLFLCLVFFFIFCYLVLSSDKKKISIV